MAVCAAVGVRAVGSAYVVVVPAYAGLAAGGGVGKGGRAVVGGQANAQDPCWRVRPRVMRVRRLIAAHRMRNQASFLVAPT
jgi:hypothetical protein